MCGLVHEGQADAVCGECHACGVVDVVDQVVDGALRIHALLQQTPRCYVTSGHALRKLGMACIEEMTSACLRGAVCGVDWLDAAHLSGSCVLCDKAKEGNHGKAAVLDLIVLQNLAASSETTFQ